MEQDALLCMNFGKEYDHYADGEEWRGVRTKSHQYTRWLDGRTELFDLRHDALERINVAEDPAHREVRDQLARRLQELQVKRGDVLQPGTAYSNWVDFARRPIHNAFGPLGDPEGVPDWSLL